MRVRERWMGLSRRSWRAHRRVLPAQTPRMMATVHDRVGDDDQRLSKCRGILIRWEKKPANYLGLLHLVCALITYRAAGLLG